MDSCREKPKANLQVVRSKPVLNIVSSGPDADTTLPINTRPLSESANEAPIFKYDLAETTGSFVDLSQNWPLCMLKAPPSQAGRFRVSYALVSSLGAVCGIFFVQDLIAEHGLLAHHPFLVAAYTAVFFFACFIQFNFSTAAQTGELVETLRQKGELDSALEQEYLRVERQERFIKSFLGMRAFGVLSLIVVALILVSSPITARFSNYDSVHCLSTFAITWFWLLGVQQQPPRAAMFGFVAACVALTSACIISGGVHVIDCFSYVSTAIIVGLVINRSGSQNLGWPPIAALFMCRLFSCWVAVVVAHLQSHGWNDAMFVQNVCVPMIITLGWSVGLLIANSLLVSDASKLDSQGRPVIPNVESDAQAPSMKQKLLAEELFEKAEELAGQLGRELQSEEYYKKAISLYPYAHEFYAKLAHLYNRQQRYKEAQVLFQVTVRVCPDAADAWQNLAALLYNQKQYSQARDACLNALKCATLVGEQLALVEHCLEDSEKRMRGAKLVHFRRV